MKAELAASTPRESTGAARRRSVTGRAVRVAVAGLLSVGCRQDVPQWTNVLAHVGSDSRQFESREYELPDGKRVGIVAAGDQAWLELVVEPDEWQAAELPGYWATRPPLLMSLGGHAMSAGPRLASATRVFTPPPDDAEGQIFPVGSFKIVRGTLAIRLPKDEPPTEEIKLSLALQSNEETAGRMWGRRFSGQALPVWPGQTVRVTVDVPEGAALSFATALEPVIDEGANDVEPVTFRVRSQGEQLFEHTVEDPRVASYAWHSVDVPGAGPVELTFEVDGTLALASFLDPVVGPSEIGTPGNRPWSEARPDILVFLADTFRADSMRVYGGERGLTPHLDAFAEESLVFRRAWSVGTYTLPSHVSMFTSVMPYEAGLRTLEDALPESLETIAERLSAAGYRTGAVTDAGIVSRRFGFDQGFGFFDEERVTIESTVDRALDFLDADDGRPMFLFVHSYRAHAPYVASEETRTEWGARLGIGDEFDVVERGLYALAKANEVPVKNDKFPPEFLTSKEAAVFIDAMEALYLGGVVDVDREFGRFERALKERRWFEHGQMIFTSDHGESFGEHGEYQHGDKVFEAKIRIPMMLTGAGIAPGVSERAASLIDLSPTVAAMAGVPPRPEWRGLDLLTLAKDRSVFSFGFDGDPTFSVVEGPRKVIGYQSKGTVVLDRLVGAYDLGQDPAELNDLAVGGADWPTEMLERYGPEVERALVPVVEARAAVLDEQDLQELNDLGYGNM